MLIGWWARPMIRDGILPRPATLLRETRLDSNVFGKQNYSREESGKTVHRGA